MAEAPASTVSTVSTVKETNTLVERIGKNKVRAIAALGLAAAALGVSGKPNTGVGVGVEWPEDILTGVTVSSSEQSYPLGFPSVPGKDYQFIDSYVVNIGGVKLNVFKAGLEPDESGDMKTIIGVYPGFETGLALGK